MEGYGLEVADQIPIEQVPGEHNRDYLRAKRDRLGHTLTTRACRWTSSCSRRNAQPTAAARRSSRGS